MPLFLHVILNFINLNLWTETSNLNKISKRFKFLSQYVCLFWGLATFVFQHTHMRACTEISGACVSTCNFTLHQGITLMGFNLTHIPPVPSSTRRKLNVLPAPSGFVTVIVTVTSALSTGLGPLMTWAYMAKGFWLLTMSWLKWELLQICTTMSSSP